MGKNNRQSRLLPASNVLQTLLANGKSPLAGQFSRWKLWRNWGEVVGETIAKNSQPVGYKSGKLYVWVPNSAHMQEMRFMVREIMNKINDHMGRKYVRSIQFTLDKKSVPGIEDDGAHPIKSFLDK